MNCSADHIRENLKTFDGGFFGPKISKSALLRDRSFYVSEPGDTLCDEVMPIMASILGVNEAHQAYEKNGRWDCDNFTILGCAIVKALHDKRCREQGLSDSEYAIWPMARSDMDHTQAIRLTTAGWYFYEFIYGRGWSIDELKPRILMVG